jgi:hypothetical protein
MIHTLCRTLGMSNPFVNGYGLLAEHHRPQCQRQRRRLADTTTAVTIGVVSSPISVDTARQRKCRRADSTLPRSFNFNSRKVLS